MLIISLMLVLAACTSDVAVEEEIEEAVRRTSTPTIVTAPTPSAGDEPTPVTGGTPVEEIGEVDGVSAQEIVENACALEKLASYDFTGESTLENFYRVGLTTRFTQEGRVNGNDYHLLISGEGDTSETIQIADIGLYSRRLDQDGKWNPWQVEYFTEKVKAALANQSGRGGVFCGRSDLSEIKFNKDDVVDGVPVKRYTAYASHYVKAYGGDVTNGKDYEKIEYWIDAGGKPIRIDHEYLVATKDHDLKAVYVFYLTSFGEPNEIVAPQLLDPSPTPMPTGTVISPGVYLVGTDIQPGIYRWVSGDMPCQWGRTNDDASTVIAEAEVMGEFYVQVHSTDGFCFTGCPLEHVETESGLAAAEEYFQANPAPDQNQ